MLFLSLFVYFKPQWLLVRGCRLWIHWDQGIVLTIYNLHISQKQHLIQERTHTEKTKSKEWRIATLVNLLELSLVQVMHRILRIDFCNLTVEYDTLTVEISHFTRQSLTSDLDALFGEVVSKQFVYGVAAHGVIIEDQIGRVQVDCVQACVILGTARSQRFFAVHLDIDDLTVDRLTLPSSSEKPIHSSVEKDKIDIEKMTGLVKANDFFSQLQSSNAVFSVRFRDMAGFHTLKQIEYFAKLSVQCRLKFWDGVVVLDTEFKGVVIDYLAENGYRNAFTLKEMKISLELSLYLEPVAFGVVAAAPHIMVDFERAMPIIQLLQSDEPKKKSSSVSPFREYLMKVFHEIKLTCKVSDFLAQIQFAGTAKTSKSGATAYVLLPNIDISRDFVTFEKLIVGFRASQSGGEEMEFSQNEHIISFQKFRFSLFVDNAAVSISQVNANLVPLVSNMESFPILVLLAATLEQHTNSNVGAKENRQFNFPFGLDIDQITLQLCSESVPYHGILFEISKLSLIVEKSLQLNVHEFKINEMAEMDPSRVKLILLVADTSVVRKDGITCSSADLQLNISITHIYIILISVLYPIKLMRLFKSDGPSEGPKHEICVVLPKIKVAITLPEDVKVSVEMYDLFVEKNNCVSVKSFEAAVFIPDRLEYVSFCRIDEIQAQFERMLINVAFERFYAPIPSKYELSNFVENVINMQKAVKQLAQTFFGITRDMNAFDASTIPTIDFKCQYFNVIICSNMFEATLGRNYLAGYENNLEQLGVYANFSAEAKSRGVADFNPLRMDHASEVYITVKKAWDMAQEHFSKTWIQKITSAKPPCPELFSAKVTSLRFRISAPDLLMSVQETLHDIDPTTPPDLLYDDLIPRQVYFSVSGIEMTLNDYSHPLVFAPTSSIISWKTTGLFIIADPTPINECLKTIAVPLDIGHTIYLQKNVNPVKFYSRTITKIVTNDPIRMCAGVSMEPALADVIQIIDNFTKPSPDPSAPIGWWDKLRQVIHGHNVIHISGGLVLRVAGSNSPYFDSSRHFGTHGLILSLGENVKMEFGGVTQDVKVVIQAEEMLISLADIVPSSEIVVSKLSGGMSLTADIGFVTKHEYSFENVAPWKQHHEVVLKPAENCRRDKEWDSYRGFRTSKIHLGLTVVADAANSSNTIFMNTRTFSNLNTLTDIYQSVLSSMPIKCGKVFNVNYQRVDKPKLGNTVGRIHLKMSLMPIFVSSIYDMELSSSGVGVRFRAQKMTVDTVLAHHQVKSATETHHTPVTKWNSETTVVILQDIEGRVLEYLPGKAGAPLDPTWTFPEDKQFLSNSEMTMISCLW